MRFVYSMVLGFVVLTAIYFVVSIYSRSVRRERLEKHWDHDNPGGDPTARADYINAGMAKYETGFRKKLIFLVYVVPIVTVGVIMYLVN